MNVEWLCSKCTYANAATCVDCEICGTDRPPDEITTHYNKGGRGRSEITSYYFIFYNVVLFYIVL